MRRLLVILVLLFAALLATATRIPAQRGDDSRSDAGTAARAQPPANTPSTTAPSRGAATPSTRHGGRRVASAARRRVLVAPLYGGTVNETPDGTAPPDIRSDAPPAPPSRTAAEPSSIQPLLASPPPSPNRASKTGRLRLDVGPANAQVYVDGFYAGTVNDVIRTAAGLSLAAGWHRLEFRAPGHETLAANVTIEADRTLSYRGSLAPSIAASAIQTAK